MPPKKWKLISSRYNGSYRIFNLRTDRAVSPRTRKAYDFYVMESTDWVNVIPVTKTGEVVLVRQYRHGIREVTLEIPGGIVEKGDRPEDTAHRELLEETGFRTREMVRLGSVYANPAFLNNRCHTFLAGDVFHAGEQAQDEKEDIEVVMRPLKEIPRLIRDGEISHSLILVAFYLFDLGHSPLKSK